MENFDIKKETVNDNNTANNLTSVIKQEDLVHDVSIKIEEEYMDYEDEVPAEVQRPFQLPIIASEVKQEDDSPRVTLSSQTHDEEQSSDSSTQGTPIPGLARKKNMVPNNLFCDICGFKTTCLKTLNVHMREHLVDMLQCDACGYKSSKSLNLKRHMLTQTICYIVTFSNIKQNELPI